MAPRVCLGAFGELGGETWRYHADRAPPHAANGTFLADPLPQILKHSAYWLRNIRSRGSFSSHADETFTLLRLLAVRAGRDEWPGYRPGAARAGNAAGPNRDARAFQQLHADAIGAASRHRGAGKLDNRRARGAVGRKTREVRRSAVPARRSRSRNSRADTRCRKYARDPSAWQPRRRSYCSAKIIS